MPIAPAPLELVYALTALFTSMGDTQCRCTIRCTHKAVTSVAANWVAIAAYNMPTQMVRTGIVLAITKLN